MSSIPTGFARQHASLNWQDWHWAFHKGLIAQDDLIQLACELIFHSEDDGALLELASVLHEDRQHVEGILGNLAKSSPKLEADESEEKWLYILLAWVFHQKQHYADPLGEVERIYANFDYPEKLEPFVRYMPAKGSYDPKAHSRSENIDRMMLSWSQYLAGERSRFLDGVTD